jgi:hypothetical protein
MPSGVDLPAVDDILLKLTLDRVQDNSDAISDIFI